MEPNYTYSAQDRDAGLEMPFKLQASSFKKFQRSSNDADEGITLGVNYVNWLTGYAVRIRAHVTRESSSIMHR
jgi:hypothetical protein